MTSRWRLLVVALTAAASFSVALPAAARTAGELDRVKALYAEASYEAALVELDGLAAADAGGVDAQQYRVLCLLALGRADDARHAAEALVTASPTFVPGTEEFPPRFVTLFTETRKRLLPSLVMKTFADGRERYRADKADEAAAHFEKVLALSADPQLASDPDIADARTLASGFLDLLKASAPNGAARPAVAAGGARPTTGAAAGRTTTSAPAAGAAGSAMIPSVVIRQELPAWVAPDRSWATRELAGAIRVVVGIDGRVKSASMQRRLHPAYDALLLGASRNWLYEPATLNGQPVESDRVIEIRLKPQTSTDAR